MGHDSKPLEQYVFVELLLDVIQKGGFAILDVFDAVIVRVSRRIGASDLAGLTVS